MDEIISLSVVRYRKNRITGSIDRQIVANIVEGVKTYLKDTPWDIPSEEEEISELYSLSDVVWIVGADDPRYSYFTHTIVIKSKVSTSTAKRKC